MTLGHFIWTDLSTHDLATAKSDYAVFFDWNFEKTNNAYDFATIEKHEVATVFPMPDRLAEIDMPSFWMSYVHVDNVDACVEKARGHENVIIEVEPQAFDDKSRIALVRDPSGAGFTLYEGPDITPKPSGHGTIRTRYHHLPDVNMISSFYKDLFGWSFEKTNNTPWPTFTIRHTDGSELGYIEEVPESIRGKFRYWMPCFEVSSLAEVKSSVLDRGGELLSELSHDRIMLADRQGAHFMVEN